MAMCLVIVALLDRLCLLKSGADVSEEFIPLFQGLGDGGHPGVSGLI